jgi:hypothetical protein
MTEMKHLFVAYALVVVTAFLAVLSLLQYAGS